MATVAATLAVNFDQVDVTGLKGATPLSSSSTQAIYGDAQIQVIFSGSLSYKSGMLNGGTVTGYKEVVNGVVGVEFTGLNVPVTSLLQWANSGDNVGARNGFLGGLDVIQGSAYGDFLRGYGGDDSIYGAGGNDTLDGGHGYNYLRGDDGADNIYGGPGFDDINGNKGNDWISGQEGADWLLGGQDNDNIYGGADNDLEYGNMGVDRLMGEAGADTLRGGQDNDILDGGTGDDWLSGDRGYDEIWGRGGADTFHGFSENGPEIIKDFNRAEGDRILLDPGTAYTVAQEGFNVRIAFGPSGFMLLENVQMSTLTGDWIATGWL